MVPYVACLRTAGPILENQEEIYEQSDVSHKTAINPLAPEFPFKF